MMIQKITKLLVIGFVLASPLTANASVKMKVFVNGYESIYKNETLGGVHYDAILYKLIKLKDRGQFLNQAVVRRNDENKYTISYMTDRYDRKFDDVLVSVMKGDYKGISNLKIESTETLPKSQLLVLFNKNKPMSNYINKCVDGDLISHYLVSDSDLYATIDAGSQLHFEFKINLDEKRIVESKRPVSRCELALIDSYRGLLNVAKLSPSIAGFSTAKKL
ncbi:hypothetical protein [Photobacterium damselae]|uniref:hypothetical protein n=1 Tax=Photobacterium damselae TaxID=38293 RepID=UPI00406965CE